jgi:hypothetical protein
MIICWALCVPKKGAHLRINDKYILAFQPKNGEK